MIIRLLLVHLSFDEALGYVINKETMDYNLMLTDMNNRANLEIAKVQSVNIDKQTL
jgi:hypothetical protein